MKSYTKMMSVLVLIFMVSVAGCAGLTPVPQAVHVEEERTYSASYDRVWNSLMAVLQKEVITVTAVDKTSGLVSGTKNIPTSTADLFMGYTNRYTLSFLIQKISQNKTKVSVRTKGERSYKNQGWDPYYSKPRGTGYEIELYDKIGSNL